MSDTGRKRPWLAALLALAYPGLGHLYLRQWARSLMWFGLVVTATVMLVPTEALQPSGGFASAADAAWTAVGSLSTESRYLLAGMVAMEMLDAYMLALGGSGEDGDSCPSCGQELDEDLAFCQWCGERPE